MLAQLDMEGLYEHEGSGPLEHLQHALTDEKKKAGAHASGDSLAGVVWTPSMRRMYTLLARCAHMLLPCPSRSPQAAFAWTLVTSHIENQLGIGSGSYVLACHQACPL